MAGPPQIAGARAGHADRTHSAPAAAPALAAAGMGTYELDLRARRLVLDDRAAELLGHGASSAAELAWLGARIDPRDRPHLRRVVRAAVAGPADYELEFRIRRPDGADRWLGTRGSVVTGEPASSRRLTGVLFDTTRDDARRVVRFLEAIPTAFFSLDRSWRFSYVNAAAERILGYSRGQLLDGAIWDLFPAAVGSDFETHYRRVMSTGEPVSFDAYYPAPLETWYEVRAWPAPDGISVYFLDVTGRRALQEQTERAARRAALTATVTAELTRTLDAEEAVADLAQILVPELADWCVITLADVDELGATWRFRDLGWWHAEERHRPLVASYARHRIEALADESFLLRALRSGEVVTVAERATEAVQGVLRPGTARDRLGELAPASVAVLPLQGRERTLGAISLFGGPRRAPMTPEELATAREVADRAGLALDNAYLYARQRDVAEQLQRSFLTEPPALDGVDVAVRYVPAAQAAKVGGDWYDVFTHPDGATVLVIGDVAGHDLHAAAAMGQIRSLLRGIAVAGGSGPGHLLTGLDDAMHVLAQDSVASAVVVRAQPGAGGRLELCWASAGHPPPMVLDAAGGVRRLTGTSLVLGVRPGTVRTDRPATLHPGETLLLYTDGLVERRDDGGLREGLQRLERALAGSTHLTLEELCDGLLTELLPEAPDDDVAIIAVRPRLAS